MTDNFLTSMHTLAWTFLSEAERLYGPRTQEWMFVGIGLNENGPHLFYLPTAERLFVQVHLHPAAANDRDMALYQLSHEVIHLLAPGSRSASMLEEGLAVKFSVDFPPYLNPTYAVDTLTSYGTYRRAYNMVERLLLEVPDAIPRLRAKAPKFSDMHPSLLVSELGIDEGLAEDLCRVEKMR